MTPARLSRALLGLPFLGNKFTHYVEIEVRGLTVLNPRSHVFVVPNNDALDITNRIVGSGGK
jgi:hypothetical protein